MNAIRFWLVSSLLGLLSVVALAADADLRASLFGQVDKLLIEAREAQAELLAPRNFSRAQEAYRDAEERLARGQSLEKIRADITVASESLEAAISQSARISPGLSGALQARKDALSSEADQRAPVLFAETDQDLLKLANDLERGRNRDLATFDQRLASGYRNAELAAIKQVLLADTRKLLAEARALRAERYAPQTLAQADALLREADAALTEDRYDADRPRALARAANIEARHAIFLARIFDDIREGRLTQESLVLQWEKTMAGIADAADLAANFHEGPGPVALAITEYIRARQSEIAGLVTALTDREQQLAQMELEIRDLEQRLGGVARERSVLQEELARQEQLRQRFRQIEAMFDSDEAAVLRESGKIILRLVGLRFDVGKADISAENFPLLAKVSSAIRVFPRARLVVEGHTDSFGSDQKNLNLSHERAEAVRQYLIVNLRLNPGQIAAVGHGEEQPIANNETKEGRARNRRIELVMIIDEET